MNSTNSIYFDQLNSTQTITIPHELKNFSQTSTYYENNKKNENYIVIAGKQMGSFLIDRICPRCGCYMHINGHNTVNLRCLNIRDKRSIVRVTREQWFCRNCNETVMQPLDCKADDHFITKQLEIHVAGLLLTQHFTLSEIAVLTGINRQTIRDIDYKRLLENHTHETEDGSRQLNKPKKYSKYIGIDEFKLHKNNKYATHITDLETGEILYIARTKKKQVVYDFIEHVGLEWMSHVKAVACDMNAYFASAFKEKCSHIKIVYDYFHLVKNLNECITGVRIEVQKSLIEEGKTKEAKSLKRCKFILTSSHEHLQELDQEGKDNKTIRKGSTLFNTKEVKRTNTKHEEIYENLMKNKEFFHLDLIKENLKQAYAQTDINVMKTHIDNIINACNLFPESVYFTKYKNILVNHMEGILTHATYRISTGKIEGINNKIKTIRRECYGLPNDEYFFLKLLDMSQAKQEGKTYIP